MTAILLGMLVALIALVMLNVPIGIALGVMALGAIVLTQGTYMLPNLALVMYEGATNFSLLAIPMFILAGAIMNSSSITQRLMDFCMALVGFIRGGLAHVNIVQSMFFAEISGSAVADVAATGPIIMPAMMKRGYSREFTAAVTSSSASLAIIIPPSIPMILYAVMGNVSVVQLFVAGIIPGILGGFAMMGISYYLARKLNWPVEDKFNLCRVWVTFKESAWALLLPLIILGGIFGGYVTATEGAALAVVAALFIAGVVHRDLDFKQLYRAAIDGAVQTAVVMILIASSALLGVYLTEQQVPQTLAAAMLSFTQNQYAVLAILNVFFLIVGLFLHSAAAIILVVPIVLPLITQIGIDPVHFGIIVTLNLAIGQQTPPVASVLIATCAIAKADIWEVTKVNVWFIATLLAVLLLVTYVPFTAMGLVDLFYK
ncbi:MAG: TRAP transporter large permease [Bradyrhizobiaceae bacterium]|nr:TRAP transporter large permease [Bradyrhizobiaceae bacterium]